MWLKYIYIFWTLQIIKLLWGYTKKTKKLALVFIAQSLIFEPMGVSYKQKSHLKWLLLKWPCVAFGKILLLFVTVTAGLFNYFSIL